MRIKQNKTLQLFTLNSQNFVIFGGSVDDFGMKKKVKAHF